MTSNDDRHLPVAYGSQADRDLPVPARPAVVIVPARPHRDRVALSSLEVIPEGDGVPVTYTPPGARVIREVADPVVEHAPHPLAAISPPTRPPRQPEPPRRIGWALAIAALAEIIVTVAAIATGNAVIGFAAVSAMAMCGMVLVAAESVGTRARGFDR